MLAMMLAKPVAATTDFFNGGVSEVLSTLTTAHLVPSTGATLSLSDPKNDGTQSESEIDFGTIQSNGYEYRALSRQSPIGDSLLEYNGEFVRQGNAATYEGSTSITYSVKNTLSGSRHIAYRFRIEQTELNLYSGGDGFEPPWLLGTGGPGVQLGHTVTLLSGGSIFGDQTLSNNSLNFWTFFTSDGDDIEKGFEQKGLFANFSPIEFVVPDTGERFTEGWTATVQELDFTVDLGLFAPDEIKTLRVEMFLKATHGTERSIDAAFADPGDFDGRFVDYTDTTAVPLPATLWLFVSALIGAGFVGRRKKKAPEHHRQ
jgi:hypothetical protein